MGSLAGGVASPNERSGKKMGIEKIHHLPPSSCKAFLWKYI
jgi:hypothetical protein